MSRNLLSRVDYGPHPAGVAAVANQRRVCEIRPGWYRRNSIALEEDYQMSQQKLKLKIASATALLLFIATPAMSSDFENRQRCDVHVCGNGQ